MLLPLTLASTLSCVAIDGDTLRCGRERVRLIGIDAPEKGRCLPRRRCVKGNAAASTRSLTVAAQGRLTIERVGIDRYGRTLAAVRGAQGDLSCWQIARGQARYRADWDNGGRIARRCRWVRSR